MRFQRLYIIMPFFITFDAVGALCLSADICIHRHASSRSHSRRLCWKPGMRRLPRGRVQCASRWPSCQCYARRATGSAKGAVSSYWPGTYGGLRAGNPVRTIGSDALPPAYGTCSSASCVGFGQGRPYLRLYSGPRRPFGDTHELFSGGQAVGLHAGPRD